MVVASRCFAFCTLITQAQINLKKFSSSKLDKFTLFTHSFVGWNLENHYKEGVSIFFAYADILSEKIRILESIFLQNKNSLHVRDFVYKTLRLVRISLLIRTVTKSLRFFSGELFYKSIRKLFSCVCIAWYKHSGYANTENLFCCLSICTLHATKLFLVSYLEA